MKNFARSLVLSVLFATVALVGPASAFAAPMNDLPFKPWTMPEYGGTMDVYTQGATMESGEFYYGNIGTAMGWEWSMWYRWTAPIAGAVRFDLCDTSPGIGGAWYMAAWDDSEGPSPLAYDVAATTGCSNAAMPQADFTAVAGKQYRIAIGAHNQQNVLALLRVTYVPQLASAPTLAGSTAVGQTLQATAPTWKTQATQHTLSAPRWMRCAADGSACTPIASQAANSYVVQAADVGATIRVEYTAANHAGSVDTTSGPTAPVTPAPVDNDGDGIPDELVVKLGIPTGDAGKQALCVQFALCENDKRLSPIFANWSTMQIIDGALLDLLLGTMAPELLIANQDPSRATSKEVEVCDGGGGNDVCIGSAGRDECRAYIGDDFCVGFRGNDTCLSKGGNDVCYGGEGIDSCMVQPPGLTGVKLPPIPKVECFGGDGQDACVVNFPLYSGVLAGLPNLSCAGGPANDVCRAAAAKLVSFAKIKTAGVLRMKCDGGSGNDRCGVAKVPDAKYLSLVNAVCVGGTGNDMCVAQGASNWAAGDLTAERATMNCTGGPGNDTLWTLNGKRGDRIDGGGQKGDMCFADPGDTVSGCAMTLRWTVSAADLKLINGTKAQRAQFVRESVATINNKRMTDEQMARMTAQFNKLSDELNSVTQRQTELMRSVFANMS